MSLGGAPAVTRLNMAFQNRRLCSCLPQTDAQSLPTATRTNTTRATCQSAPTQGLHSHHPYISEEEEDQVVTSIYNEDISAIYHEELESILNNAHDKTTEEAKEDCGQRSSSLESKNYAKIKVCVACTFANAPGDEFCKMCESPLPKRIAIVKTPTPTTPTPTPFSSPTPLPSSSPSGRKSFVKLLSGRVSKSSKPKNSGAQRMKSLSIDAKRDLSPICMANEANEPPKKTFRSVATDIAERLGLRRMASPTPTPGPRTPTPTPGTRTPTPQPTQMDRSLAAMIAKPRPDVVELRSQVSLMPRQWVVVAGVNQVGSWDCERSVGTCQQCCISI